MCHICQIFIASILLQKSKLFLIHGHLTIAKLLPKFYMKAKSNERDPNWIHENVSTAEMAPTTNHIKPNWINVHVTKMVPKSEQMTLKLKCIHEHV